MPAAVTVAAMLRPGAVPPSPPAQCYLPAEAQQAAGGSCTAAVAGTLSDQLLDRLLPLATSGGKNRWLLAALDERAHVAEAADVAGFTLGVQDQSRVAAVASRRDVARMQYNALALEQTEAALARLRLAWAWHWAALASGA
jgi:hypothetical protein